MLLTNEIFRSLNTILHFRMGIAIAEFHYRSRLLGVVILTIPTQRNFAFTLENNKLLIEQSRLHPYKKGRFAVRSCTRYVYLIFAVNLSAYMFDGVFCLFSWWCCTARFKAVFTLTYPYKIGFRLIRRKPCCD